MKTKFLITLLCLFGGLKSSHAQSSKYMIDGVDTTPLVEALNAQIITLQKPVKVYHWFNADPHSKWAEQYSANDPRGFEFAKFASQKYWNEYGKPSPDRYGAGLYAALDPIASQDFGGPNWVLLQIEFPAGSRLLNAKAPMSVPFSGEVLEVLTKLECGNVPPNIDSFFSMSRLASETSTVISKKCKMNLKTVLNSYLGMDAFMYRYDSTDLEGCSTSVRSVAWIVTNSSRFKPQNIQMFNSKTVDAIKERALIQSLFYKAAYDLSRSEDLFMRSNFAWPYVKKEIKKLYPGSTLTGFEGSEGGNIAIICSAGPSKDDSDCRNVPMPFPTLHSYSDQISSNNIPFTMLDTFDGLLWKDLDGKPTDPKIDEWVSNNLYGCRSFIQEKIHFHE